MAELTDPRRLLLTFLDYDDNYGFWDLWHIDDDFSIEPPGIREGQETKRVHILHLPLEGVIFVAKTRRKLTLEKQASLRAEAENLMASSSVKDWIQQDSQKYLQRQKLHELSKTPNI